MQELGQTRRQQGDPEALPYIRRDGCVGEIVQHQFGTLRVLPEFGHEGAQRVRVHNHIDGPVGAQEQKARRVTPAHHVRQEYIMMPPADNAAHLSVSRTFVVQFRADTAVEQGYLTGRVEHVVSGQATDFQSLLTLLAFIARLLRAEHEHYVE
jgi:hypothetical protein